MRLVAHPMTHENGCPVLPVFSFKSEPQKYGNTSKFNIRLFDILRFAFIFGADAWKPESNAG